MTEIKITSKIVKEHGLTGDEYKRVMEVLGREPNIAELGIFSVMWSEHCSYKSSRIYLRTLPTDGPRVLQGPGENAGVVDIGDGLAIAFKMESHNHPSFIEPYQGAATGVGGILRDIFTMGARPIASMNSLRFGAPDHPRTPYLVRGVVAGIGGYGNTMGVPTVGGEVFFDGCYNGNILVNAFALGLLDARRIFRGRAAGVGNSVVYVGSKTGRDGIHGATMASDGFGDDSSWRRPTVQVGDPFTEKLLLEACLELMDTDAIVGIQDMGAAGLACSSFEMAGRAGSGMEINLDRVPRRAQGMTPYEIMLSESQERMLLVVKQGREGDVRRIFDRWDLDVAVIGRVTDSGSVRAYHEGKVVVDIPVAPIVVDSPVYERPWKEPGYRRKLLKLDIGKIPVPKDMNDVLLQLISSPNLACRRWVWEQYDHSVMTNTVVAPGSDAAVIRIKDSNRGVAIATDCNSRYCYLDPYAGAALAVAEAARNISCSGAEPLAITDCLNFGNPEKPGIMWQFRQAVAGMADACRELATPVTGGNVSFYNETNGRAIYPTPTIGMVGLIDDIGNRCAQWWADDGDVVIMLGKNELDLGGSEYLQQIHGRVCGRPPNLDFAREKAVQRACRTGIRRGVIKSAHDVSDGGLAVALAECCISRPGGLLGATIGLKDDLRPDALLFGESASRILISVERSNVDRMLTIAQGLGAFAREIGTVGGQMLVIDNLLAVDLVSLKDRWSNALQEMLEA